jgi:hypothetical protein
MKHTALATKHHQKQGNVNSLVTPEMRQQIRKLKRVLDQYNNRLSVHLDLFSIIFLGLDTARQTARCLLTKDPFEAWEEIVRRREDEFDADCGILTAEKRCTRRPVSVTANVTKLITRQMRQQIVETKKKLDEFANCLEDFFRDVNKLEILNTALGLAQALQRHEPLETAEARKEREEADAEEGLD